MNQAAAKASAPPLGAASDWTVPQDWPRYTAAEHALWDTLYARQTAMLQDRAAPAFLRGIDVLKMSRPGIPDFEELSERLTALTGWRVAAVPGLVPDEVFFRHLALTRSTICRSRTSSTTCSAMCRCCPTPPSPTICRPMARAA